MSIPLLYNSNVLFFASGLLYLSHTFVGFNINSIYTSAGALSYLNLGTFEQGSNI